MDTAHLAHFELPNLITITVRDHNSQPLVGIVILVSYQYRFPPLRTNESGICTLTKEMFVQAEDDDVATGLMDHKGDNSLARYIKIEIPTQAGLREEARKRMSSKWPLRPFESRFFDDVDSLARVCSEANESVTAPVATDVDLSESPESVVVKFTVETRS